MGAATRSVDPRIVITGVRPSLQVQKPNASQPPKHRPNAYSLDWMQFSVAWPDNVMAWPTGDKKAEADLILRCLPKHEAIYMTGEAIQPLRNYSDGHRLSYARVYWHSTRRSQKMLTVLSGEELSGARAEGVTDEALIRYALDLGKLTRLDFALDIFVDGAHPLAMYEAWKAGSVETGAREVSPFTKGTKNAEGETTETSTVYFGAASSDRRVRIYDKAKERDAKYAWVRIELVTRDERAISLAETMRKHGIAEAGKSAIVDFMRCDTVDWWTDAMKGETVPLEPVERKVTNTEKWLMQQVLPVLTRVMQQQADRNMWALYDLYQTALDRHLSDNKRDSKP